MAEERFKTTLMGGFDKEDVLTQVKEIRDEAYAEKARLLKELKAKDRALQEMQMELARKDKEKEEALARRDREHEAEIAKLNSRLVAKQEKLDTQEEVLQKKYRKYIDRYDMIGGLVLESQEKADRIVADAEAKRDRLMEEARTEAQKCLDAVQLEVDDKLAEGKRKYIAVQDELNEIVDLINQTQQRFMASYREVHKIISTMPESMRELEDELEESSGAAAAKRQQEDEAQKADEPDFDEEDEEEEDVPDSREEEGV